MVDLDFQNLAPVVSYPLKHTHILIFFPTNTGCITSQRLCESSSEAPSKAPSEDPGEASGKAHIHTFWLFFLQMWGALLEVSFANHLVVSLVNFIAKNLAKQIARYLA